MGPYQWTPKLLGFFFGSSGLGVRSVGRVGYFLERFMIHRKKPVLTLVDVLCSGESTLVHPSMIILNRKTSISCDTLRVLWPLDHFLSVQLSKLLFTEVLNLRICRFSTCRIGIHDGNVSKPHLPHRSRVWESYLLKHETMTMLHKCAKYYIQGKQQWKMWQQ